MALFYRCLWISSTKNESGKGGVHMSLSATIKRRVGVPGADTPPEVRAAAARASMEKSTGNSVLPDAPGWLSAPSLFC